MPSLVGIWILLSALLVGAGWALSALHLLNPAGYTAIFLLAAAAIFINRQKLGPLTASRPILVGRKFLVRCKRAAPLLFFTLAAMSLASGLLYVPTNVDSNGYRIPRVLHWLAEGQWHWIPCNDPRINIAGSNFEWLFAPLLLFTHSDRLLFIVNWFSYLLFPGLIYSVFVRLQVRPRVAWWWMWLLPSGWCFVFQSASTVNDCFAAVYALAAVDFALRAGQSGRMRDLWLSILAAGLLTGVKQTAMPLALLWVIAIWPARRLFRFRPLSTFVVGLLAVMISGLPTMLLNHQNVGSWSGLTHEVAKRSPTWSAATLPSPFWCVVGNLFCLPVQNLEPPFFPWSNQWNAAMDHFVATPFGAHFKYFERFGGLHPGISESTAGLGLGLTFFTLVSCVVARWHRRPVRRPAAGGGGGVAGWLRMAPWLLLLLFMAEVPSAQSARQLASYYFFLFPALLTLPGQPVLTRQRWWRWLGILVMLVTVGLVVVARNRPLLPAQTLVTRWAAQYPHSGFVAKASYLYSNRRSIENIRQCLPPALPPGEKVVGYAAYIGRTEPWVWLPYGSRRVEDILPGDSPQRLYAEGIHYVVVENSFIDWEQETIQELAAKLDGELVAQWTFERDLNTPPGGLFLIHLRPPVSQSPQI